MKYAREFVTNAVVGGVLVLLPIYLAVLVLLKGMQTVVKLGAAHFSVCSRTGYRVKTSCPCWWC